MVYYGFTMVYYGLPWFYYGKSHHRILCALHEATSLLPQLREAETAMHGMTWTQIYTVYMSFFAAYYLINI